MPTAITDNESGKVVGIVLDDTPIYYGCAVPWPAERELAEMQEAVDLHKRQFDEFARQKNILAVLDSTLRGRPDFAGDTTASQLVFLALYTRWFPDPVALVFKGPSGAGKSVGVNAGLQFIPSDAYVARTGLSPKGLLSDDLDIKQKFLFVREFAGLVKGTGQDHFRQLITDHRIEYQRPDGLKTVEGPTGVLMTTTKDRLHPEEESRLLSFRVTGDVEKFLRRQAQLAAGTVKEEPLDTSLWFDLHAYVEKNSKDVVIPFAEKVLDKITSRHTKISRDWKQVLSLVQAHALVHQFTREKDKDGRIVATLDDYAGVHALVKDAVAQGLQDQVPPVVPLIVEAVGELQTKGKKRAGRKYKGCTQTQIAKVLGIRQNVISYNMPHALDAKYIKTLAKRAGRSVSGQYVLGDVSLPNGKVLPDPTELAA